MISLIWALFHSTFAANAAPPPVPEPVDTTVLDLGQSPEEMMVSEGLPPTPESGTENPEDLLRSAPAISPTKKSAKSASAKGADGLPAALPPIPGTNPPPPAASDLPPPPSTDQLAPEASTEIPSEPIAAEEPVADAAPLEEVVVPADPEAVASEGESGSSTRRFDRSIPLYERENPTWGVDIHGSHQALGTPIVAETLDVNGNRTGVIDEVDVTNFGLGFEYQPEFLQSIGVVSLGPSVNLFLLDRSANLTKNAFSIYSVGFSVKYQLNFIRGQWIVPFVGYESQMIHYSFEDATVGSGWTTASGPTFGALLALNWMEPSSAHTLWAETGIRRSYLVAEFKNLQAGETLLSTDGAAIYFGMRVEY